MSITFGTNIATGGGAITNLATGSAATDSVAFQQNKVIQTVQTNTTIAITTSTGSFVDTGLTVTITPTSASNNILIIAYVASQGFVNGSQTLNILRGVTSLSGVSGFAYNSSSSNPDINTAWFCPYLDSPATTSAITYKVQIKGNHAFFGSNTNDASASLATLTAIEVQP